jgi:glyoxylate reductase
MADETLGVDRAMPVTPGTERAVPSHHCLQERMPTSANVMIAAKPKVFVTRQIPAAGLDRIVAHCQATVWPDPLPPPRAALLQQIAGCEGVLTLLTDKVDAQFMDAAGPQLKVVSNFAVGFNNIDVAEASRRGVRVGNTPDVLTEATADMAFALLITAGRRIVEGQDYIRQGRWKTWEPLGHVGVDLWEKTVGILGMGRIGSAMARRCHGGWRMRVLYHDLHPNAAAEKEFAARRVDLETLLAESDFISVHTDLNDTTRGIFDIQAFRKMKRSAVFINTARGPLHVPGDLAQALREGLIFAAGLDVTDPEPIPLDDPLLQLANCVIAPHIASATVSSRNGMAEIAADNLLLGLAGQPLRCQVNK